MTPPPESAPRLTVRSLRAVGVEVPMTYALGTSRGTITKAPLLLIDLETEEGGHRPFLFVLLSARRGERDRSHARGSRAHREG